MSFFSVGVQEFGINSPIGFFGFKDILLEFKPSPFSLVLRGKFQVASFDAFSGDLAITQSGSDFLFGATVFRVCLVSFTVAGKLDLSNIGQSTIDAFKLGPDKDCLDKVGKAITDGLKDAAAVAVSGWCCPLLPLGGNAEGLLRLLLRCCSGSPQRPRPAEW